MRYENWPERLCNIVMQSYNKPFVWGEQDCCFFAAKVVKELTGDDHFAPFAGTYSNASEALRVLKEHDGVRGIASAALGAEIKPLLAQRGDIVLIEGLHGDTLAVCIGEKCLAPGYNNLEPVSMDKAITAWKVK
jgi:hypothetical protein